MTQMLDNAPRQDPRILVARVVGILLSLGGIGVLVLALILANSAGAYPSIQQQLGYFLIALAGFLVSAAGTDIRNSACRVSR